jgi:MFS family permease
MRPEAIGWERAAEVHAAARGWRRAGAIDEATQERIRAAFPDPCVTPGAVWRVLTGGMVAAIVLCTFAAAALGLWRSSTAIQILLLLWGVACLVATDVLEASPRSARRGAAGATSVLGVGFLLLGLGLVLVESMRLPGDDAIDVLLVAAVLTCGLAAWRWGSPLFVGLGGSALFCSLARLPHGRILWLVVGAVLTGLAAWRLDEVRLAPSHRIGAAVLTVVGIGAVYAAANVYSLDEGSLEHLARIAPSREDLPRGSRLAAAAATALLPLAVLAWGLRSRRTFLLDTGIVLLALSLVTVRQYVHLAPLWVVLILAGALLVVLALAVERALRRARSGEIAGFTADPLFSDERRQQVLQIVPVVTAFTPEARAPAPDPGFAGEGGRFGGGGAQEKF